MRRLFPTLGLIAALQATAWAQEAPTVPEAHEVDPAPVIELPPLPEGLAADVARDASGDAVEGRSLTNAAMANASAAYMLGDFEGALIHAERAAAGGEARGAGTSACMAWRARLTTRPPFVGCVGRLSWERRTR